ncbi:hypothetical protein M409DRAFT_51468 [Zasmidium cellare ATCC 36951]|uniref:37S ribosomal protein S22 n=1 Tax=Zasmidium cellare ATCC 36951 TaxID=1080233 RepID=A0A6A6CTE9_ZASCE|nr:uncharacterized protein M409DRAFT_51468 [Zasmidium cellare ATCC 36951]KAF2170424.1 hypothetical protein M409DRAFT_51468 [Zasmidium cellare ATCC 36951]
MFSAPAIRCNTCRLRSLIRIQQLSRSRKAVAGFATSGVRSFPRATTKKKGKTSPSLSIRPAPPTTTNARDGQAFLSQRQQVHLIESLYTSGQITREEWRESVWIQAGLREDREGRVAGKDGGVVRGGGVEDEMRRLKEWYKGVEEVPGELLEEGERVVYVRLFGGVGDLEVGRGVVGDEEVEEDWGVEGTGLLREGRDGLLEEVVFEEEGEGVEHKKRRRKRGDEVLVGDITAALEGRGEQEEDAAETRKGKKNNWETAMVKDIHNSMESTQEDKEESMLDTDAVEVDESDSEDGDFLRTHPLTAANRFETSPSTLNMPRHTLTEPIETMLANMSNKHIHEHAHRIFGGPGLPYSTSTPLRGKPMPEKPIALDAYQSQMAPIEADVYMASLIPGVYASVMSVLVETRKRLGTQWAREIVEKAERAELRILDAGGGGAGVLAVREMIRAEWEIAHEESHGEIGSSMAMAEVDGKAGGEGVRAPLGQATVLTGSDTLRKRAAKLLENTTFVPRLPDYIHTEAAKHKGKFDIVIAPHTLWPLKEDYIRKTHVQNLWSLVSADGGILLLMEKGVPRGFEMVAGARDMLLETKIASPGSTTREREINEFVSEDEASSSQLPNAIEKEEAMIIAPCTNHAGCPMYQQKGKVKGRKDICAFSQRYHRPPFLQRIFGAKGKNHEDVEFSYLSLLRGRDLRSKNSTPTDEVPVPIEQSSHTTDLAFAGHATTTPTPHPLTLPRLVLPPLKRKGHVILDLCTPAGTLERWTVPRSFSRQAYRDARKASWGDLWALGAKTRVPRRAMVRKQVKDARDGVGKEVGGEGDLVGSDEFGRVVFDRDGAEEKVFEGGRVRGGVKVKGVRDKRDKKGDGRGRRKNKN